MSMLACVYTHIHRLMCNYAQKETYSCVYMSECLNFIYCISLSRF